MTERILKAFKSTISVLLAVMVGGFIGLLLGVVVIVLLWG
jgi:hypothetical protein